MSDVGADAEALIERRGAAGVVVLNRPKALNALTLTMVRLTAAALDAWRDDPSITRVVMLGAGKAFCAGDALEACFSLNSREAILAALEAMELKGYAFAAPARAAMLTKSPTSQALALRQMALGPKVDFDEALRIEYRIVSRVCRGHDFYEGVRAVIVDKDSRPAWSAPPSAAELDAYFAPLGDDELTFPPPRP